MPKQTDNQAFEIEAAIRSWRTESRGRHIRPAALEELERHLRDSVDQHIARGMPAETAAVVGDGPQNRFQWLLHESYNVFQYANDFQ